MILFFQLKECKSMNIIDLETPLNTEKYFAPKTDNEYPFYITEYGKTCKGTPCYQLRMASPIGCAQYCIDGSGVIICNDKIYTAEKGDTFLLPEGSSQIYYSNPDNCFERIWINFKGALAQDMLKIYGISDTVVFKNADTSDMFAKIHRQCKRQKDPKEYKNITSRLFLELVQFLSDNKNSAPKTTSAVEQMRLFIDCRITENLKLSDIARHFSLSVEHTIRVFRKNYGITPHQYILQSKIRLAMIMLKMTGSSVEEIAEKLGFSDLHHFSTQFKKLMDCTPSAYRKS